MQAILLVIVFSCLLGTEGAVDDACTLSTTCTPATTICDNLKCKTKADVTCSAADECVSRATCTGTPKKCACDDGYTASSDLCTVIADGKVNAACDAIKVCTGTNVDCKGGFCTCNDGFSGNKGDNDCTSNKGIALGQVSLWTLCMTIMTMWLAVNVV